MNNAPSVRQNDSVTLAGACGFGSQRGYGLFATAGPLPQYRVPLRAAWQEKARRGVLRESE